MLIVVIDTNVLVGGLLKGRVAAKSIQALVDNKFILVISQSLIDELIDTIRKPKLARLISASETEELLSTLLERASVVNPAFTLKFCRDPDDDMFLSCAVEGEASHIISWDQDLSVLSPFKGIEILTPGEFLKKFHIK